MSKLKDRNMTNITIEKVYNELKILRNIIEELKEDIEDRFLTAEEEILIEKALEEMRQGKTKPLEELMKELQE